MTNIPDMTELRRVFQARQEEYRRSVAKEILTATHQYLSQGASDFLELAQELGFDLSDTDAWEIDVTASVWRLTAMLPPYIIMVVKGDNSDYYTPFHEAQLAILPDKDIADDMAEQFTALAPYRNTNIDEPRLALGHKAGLDHIIMFTKAVDWLREHIKQEHIREE